MFYFGFKNVAYNEPDEDNEFKVDFDFKTEFTFDESLTGSFTPFGVVYTIPGRLEPGDKPGLCETVDHDDYQTVCMFTSWGFFHRATIDIKNNPNKALEPFNIGCWFGPGAAKFKVVSLHDFDLRALPESEQKKIEEIEKKGGVINSNGLVKSGEKPYLKFKLLGQEIAERKKDPTRYSPIREYKNREAEKKNKGNDN